MNTYNMVKQEFLKKWITTLHMLDSFVGYPTNVRKDMIRLSLDTAIAAARSGATIWRLTRNRTTNKHVVRRILKKARNRVKNRCTTIGRNANFTANVRVRKRMELLKRLVPGSELIDKDNDDYLIK
ncbi:hypothetical protein DY000_02001175 [Brassica cretica]|uniref:Uncharacterized protein n=1 Tax=Brassica cretica TaxID=69181 RepID=A0ABQ7C2P1_BRACR|nr:hypothetical protein DY000_02001175 [Brassica cretica]